MFVKRIIESTLVLFVAGSLAQAQNQCSSLFANSTSEANHLSQRYGINPSHLEYTSNDHIPVILKMSDHDSLVPHVSKDIPSVSEIKRYDVVIAGGGPAGLTAALYLAEAGKSVLILERNSALGGLAMGSELKGIRSGGGAAYSAGPGGGLEYKIFQKIGLGDYKKKLSIEEPIDSYLWNGKLYKGIWEDHTLKELPISFTLFKHALLKLSKLGASDTSGAMAEWADNQDMATMVRQMPEIVKTWKDKESRNIWEQYLAQLSSLPKDSMKDVIDLLDLYGRSALGGTTDKISARQFMDFYESEIYTRYTGSLGTGSIVEALIAKLKMYPNLVEFRTSSPVASIENTNGGTKTIFVENGVAKNVKASKVLFAASVNLAPKIIKNLKEQDREKVETISSIQMSDYAVHVVRLKGHPYRATYDTWSASNGDQSKPTDFILGRWQDSKVKAYEGMRNFESEPQDDYGVMTIYQPLGPSDKKHFSKEENLKMVESAVEDMTKKISNIDSETVQPITVELVESYRWPESIHIVSPGYLKKTPILARPTGNIYYGNNTIGAPELETSMARAAQQAMAIITDLGTHKKTKEQF